MDATEGVEVQDTCDGMAHLAGVASFQGQLSAQEGAIPAAGAGYQRQCLLLLCLPRQHCCRCHLEVFRVWVPAPQTGIKSILCLLVADGCLLRSDISGLHDEALVDKHARKTVCTSSRRWSQCPLLHPAAQLPIGEDCSWSTIQLAADLRASCSGCPSALVIPGCPASTIPYIWPMPLRLGIDTTGVL